MELQNGDEKRSLPLCVYVAGFGKSSHIFYEQFLVAILESITNVSYLNSCLTVDPCNQPKSPKQSEILSPLSTLNFIVEGISLPLVH